MSEHCIRPASTSDVERGAASFPELLVDRWREGNNRRSLVAVAPDGAVLGHCRGIDNDFHPGSRVMVLDVLAGLRGMDVEHDLVAAQIECSTAPLEMKVDAGMVDDLALARHFGAVVVQLMPPWRWSVTPELVAWAQAHRGGAEPIGEADREAVRLLEARHYVAQHRSWSPSAPLDVLLEKFAEDHDPSSGGCYDLERSCLVREGDSIVAAALLWPAMTFRGVGGREVGLLAWPRDGERSEQRREACLASVICSAEPGDVLFVDSHLTEVAESRVMARLREAVPPDSDEWGAILRLPLPGGDELPVLPAELVPDGQEWVADFLPR